ncbi:outer membrane beta-barrel protein [Seonamhaeicola maritimus]|uniref:Outer membrane beta-barrel protein n=2 Tax=Seonamhaeicola maritimus TaxID=2591822 RepID=A0A5C7GND8_9FLAO|nr:outer membrane beta-barrel protein [Seonamhaeicola maritimus]
MNRLIITSFLMILCVFTTYAQPQPLENSKGNSIGIKDVTVTGKVIDKETKDPLEYATISFFSKKENKILTGSITDVNGDFSVKVPQGFYDIKIEYISFKTRTIPNKQISKNENIGVFELEIDMESLDEVEIIAERTTVEVRLDKKIYNVGKDLTVRGGNVSDVLDNVPSVSVDAEGNVALRGNENVRILINGKPSGLVGLNSSDALQQLPAEAIEKVEVITSPSARYEAEGTAGILNIILRRSKLLGLNGAITANVGHPESAGISGNINYRTGNVNIFNTVSYNYGESIGHWYTTTTNKEDRSVFDEKRDWTNVRKGLTNNIGIEWYINDSASLTTSLVYSEGDRDRFSENIITQFDSNFNPFSESIRLDPELGDNKTIQYSVNFTKNFKSSGHKLTFDFQYEENDQNENSLINSDGVDTDILSNLQASSKILLRSDYILPLGENSQFEIGYRGDYSDSTTDYTVLLLDNNTNTFEIDRNLSNVFNYRNYIHAAYMQFGSKINKFSYLLGLRMENTQLTLDQPTSGDFERRNLTGLFPTVNLSYEFSEDQNITLGFNRRLSRPWSFFLNPYPSRSSLTNVFQGNPGLNPTYAGKIDLGYLNRMGKFILSSSLYHQHSTNIFKFISSETGEFVNIDGRDLPVIVRSPGNVASEDRLGFEFNLTYSPSRKWRMNTNFNLFNSVVDGEANGINFDYENLSWNARFSNKYTLPGSIDWQSNFSYRGRTEDAQNVREGVFGINQAFSKDLFKEKASIAFSINDLLNSNKFGGTVDTPLFFTERDIRYRGGRTYKLSFTYRFNQKKKVERGRGDYGGGGDVQI